MNDPHSDLQALVQSAQEAFAEATTPADLENAKARFLGKSGSVTELLKGMGALTPEEKKTRGAAINQAKQRVEAALTERRQALLDAELAQQLRAESLDVTLPGRRRGEGGLHPVSLSIERIEGIFGSMGFAVADGPEIETDWFNFTALNTPEDHPARSMHDTFYVEGGHLLRTHTSPMQVRYAVQHVQRHAQAMAQGERMPDLRVIAPGRTYRVDSDATHSPMFHQCEGLWIGENVSFTDLKAMLGDFFSTFFETDELDIRFRPSFFPSPSRRPRWTSLSRRARSRALAGSGWGRAGAPERGAQLWAGSRALHRLRLRPGPRSPDHAALWRQRFAPVLRRRSALPAAVPVKDTP
jgi:phenylalanyl-tRNA synthetase alpha chain